MSGGDGGGVRVTIPTDDLKTIQYIRESTGKQHSDDEIYALLKECSMDPNETANKLLYLDTFHEVKTKKRDRKKENFNSQAYEDRSTSGLQRRNARALQGNNFSDASGGRNAAARRDNGAYHMSEKGSTDISKTKNNAAPHLAKGSAATNGPTSLPNGSSNLSHTSQSMAASKFLPKSNSIENINNSGALSTQPSSDGSIKDAKEQLSHSATAELNHNQGNGHSTPVDDDLESSKNDEEVPRPVNSNHLRKKAPRKSEAAEKKEPLAVPSSPSLQSSVDDSLAMQSLSIGDSQSPQEPIILTKEEVPPPPITTDASLNESKVTEGQQVIFPEHFYVPEYLKNGLTFGSFEINMGQNVAPSDGDNDSAASVVPTKESSETTEEPSNCIQTEIATEKRENLEQPQALPLDSNVSSSDASSKDEQMKEILSSSEGISRNHDTPNALSYSLGLISPIIGTHPTQSEAAEHPPQESSLLSNFVNGNTPPALSSPTPTPSVQGSSIPLTHQSVPVYRQPYPPNYFPYGHYYPPYYMPPMPQYLNHSGYPQTASTGNMFLQPQSAAAAAGVKFPLPQFKPGANPGNPTHPHMGFAAGGPYIPTQVGYGPGSGVTSASSAGNDDLMASQLKENHIYSTGQMSEGSPVWISGLGQDMPSMHMNSLYNLSALGQNLTFPSAAQAGHGPFSGIYQPRPTMAAATPPSTVLSQSQALAGGAENLGPQSGAYQQPQAANFNWSTNF